MKSKTPKGGVRHEKPVPGKTVQRNNLIRGVSFSHAHEEWGEHPGKPRPRDRGRECGLENLTRTEGKGRGEAADQRPESQIEEATTR